ASRRAERRFTIRFAAGRRRRSGGTRGGHRVAGISSDRGRCAGSGDAVRPGDRCQSVSRTGTWLRPAFSPEVGRAGEPMTVRVLEGRSAVVTGASQGLGLTIAREFAHAGANVVICARDEHALHLAADDVTTTAAKGTRVVALRADVSRE